MNTTILPFRAGGPFTPEEAGAVIDVGRMLHYRLARLQKAMVDEDCCGLLLLGVHNKRYATGMLRSGIYNAHKPSSAVFVPASGLNTIFDWIHPDNPHETPETTGELRPMPVFAYFPAGELNTGMVASFAATMPVLSSPAGK